MCGNGLKLKICCICKEPYYGMGNNPYPIKERGRCCDKCDAEVVLPERLKGIEEEEKKAIEKNALEEMKVIKRAIKDLEYDLKEYMDRLEKVEKYLY